MGSEKNRDPVQCENAKQDFWDRERELIKEGKGTRDWTPEQQEQIMNLKNNGEERKHAGVPKDKNGNSYEAHHMKSAEAYPEHQGNADNMQALNRDEHQAAHNGNFRNSTNGEYNHETGETKDFGEKQPTSPEPHELSNPVYKKQAEESNMTQNDNTSRSSVTDKLNSMGHKHTDAETKRNPNPVFTREKLHEMKSEQSSSNNMENSNE
jgi:hypothetical protein